MICDLTWFVIQVLLEYGAQADIQGSWGQTPLMLCILVEYFEIAELLLNNNSSIIDQQDSSGNTPLHIAIGTVFSKTFILQKVH